MRGSIFFVFILAVSFVLAQDLPNYQDKYVNDFASVLSIDQSNYLENIFYLVEQNSSAEVVFLSVTACSPLTSQEYALEIFDFWKIGKADKDNGLLILYCAKESKIFAMTGYGLEGILPDSKLGRFLDETYVPLRDSGNVSGGIISFSEVVVNEIILNSGEVMSSGKNEFNKFFLILGVILFFIISFVFVSRAMVASMGLHWYRLVFGLIFVVIGAVLLPMSIGIIFVIIGFIIFGAKEGKRGFGFSHIGSSSSGGFGGGGGGFGGGSSGGGGAGR